MKILVIDDVYIARHTIKASLEEKGIFVDEAANGKNALGLIKNNAYDYILLDLGLPDIDGIELFRKIKEINNDIKVIVISGYSDKQILKECILLGCIHYLLKPVNIENVIDVITKSA